MLKNELELRKHLIMLIVIHVHLTLKRLFIDQR